MILNIVKDVIVTYEMFLSKQHHFHILTKKWQLLKTPMTIKDFLKILDL